MLRRSIVNPKMSAYTQLFGSFDYNQTPIAPLGTKAFAHKKNTKKDTYGSWKNKICHWTVAKTVSTYVFLSPINKGE